MLKKIPLRIILRNKSQFLGIILLVFFASFTYALFSIMFADIDSNYKKFVEDYKQETFHFITLNPIDIEELSQRYNIEIEERFQADYEFKDKTLRIFNISSKVNKPFTLSGTLPKLGEIAIDPNFARENGLEIGDEIEIYNKRFKISGYLYLPDYVYIIKNDQDILPDPVHFGIGVMNIDELKTFISYIPYHYYMARGTVENFKAFKSEINSKYKLLTLQERRDNFRIVVTEKKMESARPLSYVISIFVLLISSILLFIVLNRLITSMHTEIGTLYALGYNQKEISNVYLMFPVLIWLFGAIPGGVIGYLGASPFTEFYTSFFNIPLFTKILPFKELITAIILPATFMLLSGYISIRKLLRKSVLSIIRGELERDFNKRYRMAFLNRFSFKNRLMLKQGLLYPAREIVLILGIAFATIILMYGITGGSALNNTVEDTYKNVLKYNYMYIFNNYQTENNYPNTERFSMLQFNIEDTKAKIVIYGIEKGSQMVILKGDRGEKINLDSFVITKSLADKFRLKPGDTINLVNTVDGKKYSLKIGKVADIYVGNSGYMNLEEFNRTFGLDNDSFLGLYSSNRLEIPRDKLLTSMDKEYLIKVFRDNAESINQMLQVMYVISFFLSLIIIYVLSSITISENRKPIGIFKILGYYDVELSSIFLGFNNFSFLIGFLLGIPLFNLFIDYIMNVALKDMDFSLNMKLDIKNLVTAFIVLLIAFVFSRYLGRRRIYSIPPNIILKEQAE
ncbi:FtsX-like permease family protein [bacterium]|nr:FtsX-like permease family protein [bacterium]